MQLFMNSFILSKDRLIFLCISNELNYETQYLRQGYIYFVNRPVRVIVFC